MTKTKKSYPRTPDGRYFVVRGRLWRLSNPALSPERRDELVKRLMRARRDVRDAAGDPLLVEHARLRVDSAKRALGERGPVWWDDDAPDYNRRLVQTTPYARWYSGLPPEERTSGRK
jgi:cobalamin biosynthesis Mg chelatase CobN